MCNRIIYYKNYQISDQYWSLGTEDIEVLEACSWMVEYHSTIRETAETFGYSATTFWRRIHYRCKDLSPELYRLVCKQMKDNKRRYFKYGI